MKYFSESLTWQKSISGHEAQNETKLWIAINSPYYFIVSSEDEKRLGYVERDNSMVIYLLSPQMSLEVQGDIYTKDNLSHGSTAARRNLGKGWASDNQGLF